MNFTRRTMRRAGFWTAAVLAGLLGAAATLQAMESRRSQPAGGLFTVEGRRMHLRCSGTGSVTVVLEAGAAETAGAWAWVQEDVAPYTRVCSYDRAGLGWSEGRGSRDADRIAGDLDALLA